MEIKVLKLHSDVSLPEYQTAFASGADIRAYISEPLTIKPYEQALVPTGLSFEIPEGYEMQLRPRSGLALKKGLTLLNTPGTIDADYRGEVKVILFNTSKESVVIENGERIAQAVICPVVKAEWKSVAVLSETKRSNGGFGSTGV